MSEWQPIETAPKDGTIIRLYIPGHPKMEGMEGRFYDGEWEPYPQMWTLGSARNVPDPTFWMPRYNSAAGESVESGK